ncbi:hypothetical protein TraAM80_09448 [Trypanosoma rangeli]|uniref:Uncharacterized protein n=1 Tax=Trypanosoma rangeli TaxID=5698 RepID=A0A422MVG1_TRYRA|nr:uncharacterized protein TraAM80_09448 [Trypanosoma rangeli]RNE97176.1 hypothetical protein TraAM80_09448 [Trypanosoma rangeli]|eukprot:RNE97176.1 hypothetical protein TraAM80_09448 [Trypanosoma rangeli]
MLFDVADTSREVDLSKLISFSMSFQPLQLLLQSILKRVQQAETDNEQQDDEIAQLKKAVEDLRKQDAEREAQQQELLRQLEELRKMRDAEERGEEEGYFSQGEAPPTDLRPLWDEINRLKALIGEVQRPGRRPTIEQLYRARKRQGSATSLPIIQRPKSVVSSMQGMGALEEVESHVGDAILDRAKERLVMEETVPPVALLPEESAATGELVEPPRRSEEKKQQERDRPTSGQELRKYGEEEKQRQQQSDEQKPSLQLSEGKGAGGDLPAPFLSGSGVEQPFPTRSESPFALERSGPSSSGGAGPVFSSSSFVTPSKEQLPVVGASSSIYNHLVQDSADIGYLNRVVAEMLNEMKVIHADVDLMRTVRGSAEDEERPTTTDPNEARERANLQRRVELLEDAVRSLQKGAGAPDAGTGAAHVPKDPRWDSLPDDVKALKGSMNALEQALERTNNKLAGMLGAVSTEGGDTGVSPAQLGALSAAVDMLEKQLADLQRLDLRNYDNDLEALRRDVEKLQRDTAALQKTCALLDENKEDKGIRRPSSVVPAKEETEEVALPLPAAVKDTGDDAAALNDLRRRADDLLSRMARAEANVIDLDEHKADVAAVQRLADELKQLRQLLELGAGTRGDDDATSSAATLKGELVEQLQKQIAEHVQNFNQVRDGTTNELDALRDYVEQIDHRKADAMLVANKAERDYVENALERLMREVEQVLNATNAGLIDTLDKSLNVLRDLLDGKATKQDMDRLRRIVSEDHIGGGVPDALAGFRGFRCLGCNRPVETMRPRVMGSRLQPFVNRLPQNHPGENTPARIQQGSSGATDGASTVAGGS